MIEIIAKKGVLRLRLLFGCLVAIIPRIGCNKRWYS